MTLLYYCLLLCCLILMTRCSGLLSKFEMFGSLEAQLLLGLTLFAFKTKNDFTCGLRLLMKNGFSLSTKTHLFRIVSSLSLSEVRRFSSLVLGDLVEGVLLALTRTVCLTFFGYIHHDAQNTSFVLSENGRKEILTLTTVYQQ